MAAQTDDTALLQALAEVFQTHGYEGTSLNRLAEATGLAKASLYHRFPEGKVQMARAVMKEVVGWLGTHALEPLGSAAPPRERFQTMCAALDEFYHGGRRSCLLDALSFGGDDGPLKDETRGAMQAWTDAIAGSLRRAGLPAELARRRAEDALIRIQGSLIVSRVLDSPDAFQRTLRDLPDALLAPVPG